VCVTFDGRTIPARVALANADGRPLALAFVPELTVQASQPTAGLPIVATATLPARLWCQNLTQPTVIGAGCN
jgi:hypothetical protein